MNDAKKTTNNIKISEIMKEILLYHHHMNRQKRRSDIVKMLDAVNLPFGILTPNRKRWTDNRESIPVQGA